jgi:hypothetical protein
MSDYTVLLLRMSPSAVYVTLRQVVADSHIRQAADEDIHNDPGK